MFYPSMLKKIDVKEKPCTSR